MSRREQETLKHFERMIWIGVGVMILLLVSVMSVIILGGVF